MRGMAVVVKRNNQLWAEKLLNLELLALNSTEVG
jgi:hypothetical protein